jgi:hypothetical protein
VTRPRREEHLPNMHKAMNSSIPNTAKKEKKRMIREKKNLCKGRK